MGGDRTLTGEEQDQGYQMVGPWRVFEYITAYGVGIAAGLFCIGLVAIFLFGIFILLTTKPDNKNG